MIFRDSRELLYDETEKFNFGWLKYENFLNCFSIRQESESKQKIISLIVLIFKFTLLETILENG
jgi:hypothetical protein